VAPSEESRRAVVKMSSLISGWFTPFPEQFSRLDLVAVVAFVLWTAVSIFVYLRRRQLFAGNGALIGLTTRYGPYAITIGCVGLFLLLMRYLGVPYIDMRFLLYLTVLAAIGFLGFLAYYLRWRYPARLAAVRAEEQRRKYASDRRRRRRR
jgi:hypothetical protein